MKFFAPFCQGCEQQTWQLFCKDCASRYRFQNACPGCGHYPLASEQKFCWQCENKSHAYRNIWISYFYEGPVEKWIKSIKSQRKYFAWKELRLKDLPEGLRAQNYDKLCYVASDPDQIRRRSFDNSFTLGKRISQILGLSVQRNVFMRQNFLKTQRSMNRKERENFLRQLVKLHRPITGQKLLLVDDVMTSGVSLQIAAEMLEKAGNQVDVYVVARKLKAPLTLWRRAS